ncbi:phosphatase PAP2 family protein [Aliiglaciecola sp. CAU 1673]|uniref:phosphatase PAP2 family protein n=1 Tax=Aliiglaciecola sp. CAU 1673 TaxID=3032595 RepID=UPI0023DBA834|nr:phosphatase PAP2 family protein [Aliiglaciecola sp. CAU 1673]MDF2179195.1 phosphatase PAP2 family protein [Aliiglaciecola sp. CAU 1673]
MKLFARADTQLFYWLFNKTAGKNCRLIRWVSRTGDGHLYLLIGLLLWAFEPEHGALFLYTGLLAYALELPLYVILKKSFKRQRPCDLFNNFSAHISPSDKFSLPSGHTAAAFLMASLIAHFYPGFSLLVYGWATTVGLSRVLLGVHYPSDIAAGAVLGLTMSVCSIAILP